MIRIHNIWKAYEGVQVLKGLTLDIPQSKVTIILGRSGVGKSVLLRHILGLEMPDSGEIEINGISITSCPEPQRHAALNSVGMLFQSSALFDSLTVGENIAFPLIHHQKRLHCSLTQIGEAVQDALEKVGLSGYRDKFPSELSGGQKRRAAIARLIAYHPKILLFDEPTTGLDPVTAHQIASLITETQQHLNATTVIVTHDIVTALSIGHFFALHTDGNIPLSGDKKAFFASGHPLIEEFVAPFETRHPV